MVTQATARILTNLGRKELIDRTLGSSESLTGLEKQLQQLEEGGVTKGAMAQSGQQNHREDATICF